MSGTLPHGTAADTQTEESAAMHELVRTNDPVLLSYIESLLAADGISVAIFDTSMSVLEGSLGILPRRIMVAEPDRYASERILTLAGLASWIRSPA